LRPKVAARLITIDAEALSGIPEVIAVASGRAKGAAVRAALEGRLVQGLVVDHELADSLLAD
jgi:DNA-binding transcriptional regulator LsrR (DeoR family)